MAVHPVDSQAGAQITRVGLNDQGIGLPDVYPSFYTALPAQVYRTAGFPEMQILGWMVVRYFELIGGLDSLIWTRFPRKYT
jgi:hypothetical protein